jgi:hypothetical protein
MVRYDYLPRVNGGPTATGRQNQSQSSPARRPQPPSAAATHLAASGGISCEYATTTGATSLRNP